MDGGLQHRAPAFPTGLSVTPRVHSVPTRCVSGLTGSTPQCRHHVTSSIKPLVRPVLGPYVSPLVRGDRTKTFPMRQTSTMGSGIPTICAPTRHHDKGDPSSDTA